VEVKHIPDLTTRPVTCVNLLRFHFTLHLTLILLERHSHTQFKENVMLCYSISAKRFYHNRKLRLNSKVSTSGSSEWPASMQHAKQFYFLNTSFRKYRSWHTKKKYIFYLYTHFLYLVSLHNSAVFLNILRLLQPTVPSYTTHTFYCTLNVIKRGRSPT
jgi:hypothetical protein